MVSPAFFQTFKNRMQLDSTRKPDPHTPDSYYVFAFIWALYAIFHFFYMGFYYANVVSPLSWLTFGLAVTLALRPLSHIVFGLLIGCQLVEVFWQMPLGSNHAIIQFFLTLGIALAGLQALYFRRSWGEFYASFAPLGRWLLIAMYFYGIFHKINTDFLNPEVSCAVALWVKFPLPQYLLEATWAHYCAIYGTFIIEGFVMLTLMTNRLRYYGIVVGMLFHLMLGFNSYAFYPAFSLISFALHALFFPNHALKTLAQSRLYPLLSGIRQLLAPILLVYGLVLYLAMRAPSIAIITAAWLPFGGALWLAAIACARDVDGDTRRLLNPRIATTAILSVLFFINGLMPYTGFKTTQSIAMFSNLHLEGGRSNHLVITRAPTAYLTDTLYVESITPDGKSGPLTNDNGMSMVYLQLLMLLNNNRDMRVTYVHNGERRENASYASMKAEIENSLPPWLIRKFQYFAPVDFRQPKQCNIY